MSEDIEGWFPTTTDDVPGWRLDIVSLLAVIGEDSLKEHSQPMTASFFGLLPRIIPAPQVLLKPSRPLRMPGVPATVVGVHSGVLFNVLNYFPNILFDEPVEELPPYSFRHYKITHDKKKKEEREGSWKKKHGDGAVIEKRAAGVQTTVVRADLKDGISTAVEGDPERVGVLRRRSTIQKISQTLNSNSNEKPPHVPAKTYSPLNLISVLSCGLSCGLFALSVTQKDGVACVALAVIWMYSVIVGYASWWQPELMKAFGPIELFPDGSIVIRTREGAFVVVECNEEVARELFSGTEKCKYAVKSQSVYRVLVGISTFLVMVSVVLLGNCNFLQQATIGGSYILLNGLYWCASLADKKYFWDLSLYHVEDLAKQEKEDERDDIRPTSIEDRVSYTRTLWKAIKATKKVGWIKKSDAAPHTDEWDKWLKEAQEEIDENNLKWPAVQRKNEIIGQTDANGPKEMTTATIHGIEVPGGQQAPPPTPTQT